MAIDETKLTKGQIRKLNALRKSVGDELGADVFNKWLAHQAVVKPKPDSIVEKITAALADLEHDPKFRLGNYGYTVRRARGKGTSGFSITKNEKPR